MCTVTLIARRNGYALGMNRDEKRTRVAGLPPKLRFVNQRAILCPSEPGGGTWLALNDSGVTLALINWYSITARVKANPVSRGDVVNAVSAAASFAEAASALNDFPLHRTNAFRLIGIFPAGREVVEWLWDLKRLVRKQHRWRTQQWISSGFDEPEAQRIRGRTFRLAQRQRSAGTLEWLRRLHASHAAECGPFSTCMHRDDAATVSYTEAAVSARRATLRYRPGFPCAAGVWCVGDCPVR
ncbi:MAG: hypothetical protein EXS35_17915 [Pedosphaera sp.]|nr:hypothetical protein [Pedosphaera sp.]